MKISELLLRGERMMESSSSPRLDAELLLAHVYGFDRAHLFTRMSDPVSTRTTRLFYRLVRLRAKGMPVAYLTGFQDTPAGPLYVDPRVLVPRPTTELLIESVIEKVTDRVGTIADIGTGSGVIAISLAQQLPQHQIEGSDISLAALEVARQNAARHNLERRITWRVGSLLAPWAKVIEPQIIVANLPYVPSRAVQKSKLHYEPRLALEGGRDGLAVIRTLMHQVKYHPLIEIIALECQPDQVDTLGYWLRSIRPTSFRVTPIKDGNTAWGVVGERY